jgi:PST family polysaccharide transporter
VFAAVFAGDFSRLLFGPAWDRAALISQLLAFSAWRNVTGHTTGAVLLSQGRPDLQLRWTTISFLLSLVYFAAGRPWGLEGVAAAAAVLEISGWAIRHTMANSVLDLTWRRFAATLSPLWIAHALFLLWAFTVRYASLVLLSAPILRLAIAIPLATAGYLVIVRLVVPGLLTTLGRGMMDCVSRGLARRASDVAVESQSSFVA